MSRKIVMLVDERTLPNLQFIHEFGTGADEYIFITTRKMEVPDANRVNWIIKSAGIDDEKCSRLVCDPHGISQTSQQLSGLNLDLANEYLVHITCGTKIMALAAYSFFGRFPKARIIFSFLGEGSYRQLHPHITRAEHEYKTKPSLKASLLAHGLKIAFADRKLTDVAMGRHLMDECIKNNNRQNHIPEIRKAMKCITPEERSYFSGGWFEEYVYDRIKTELKLADDQIAMKVSVRKAEVYNEFDVIFLYRDRIHVVECKAYFSRHNLKTKVEGALYKLGALDDKFGMNTRSLFFTNLDFARDDIRLNEVLRARAKDLKVRFVDMSDIRERRLNLSVHE